MKKARKPTLPAPDYVLSEAHHLQLQKLCNQWLLMAEITVASTLDEEQAPLHISRAMLGEWFESAALQLQAVLEGTVPGHKKPRDVPRQHW